jgi:hypothetical protein
MSTITLRSLSRRLADVELATQELRQSVPDLAPLVARIGSAEAAARAAGEREIPSPVDLRPVESRLADVEHALTRLKNDLPGPPEPTDLTPVHDALAILRDDMAAQSARLADVAESVPTLPADLVRRPDIPDPVDLAPTLELLDQLAARQTATEKTVEAIRSDVTETRRWLADLGRTWQNHQSRIAEQVSGLSTRLDTLASRPCPEIPDIAPVAAEVAELRETINDIIGGE